MENRRRGEGGKGGRSVEGKAVETVVRRRGGDVSGKQW